MRRVLLVILCLGFALKASAATRLDDEGTTLGYINALNCVGTDITCTKSGITGVLTMGGSETDFIPASGNSFEIYADISNRLWIVNRTSGVILLGFLADGTLFSPNLNCNGANTFVTSRGGNLICASVAGSAGGTVTSITAGNQLTGGTITGSGTIAVSTTPTFTSLTLSAGTPQIQLTPSSGNAHEIYDFNSQLYFVNTTTNAVLMAFDAAGAPFLPGLICTGSNTVVNITSTGRLLCGSGSGSGTVTSITAGTGLGGGTITTSGTISLTTPVTAANGGTGNTTNTLNGVLYGNGGSAILATTQGASNTVLTANAGAPSFSATPTIQSLTLSATTPQVQLTPSSGNAHEIYDSNSVLYITNTTTGQVLLAFDAAGAPFLPGLTCTGNNTAVNITSTGRLLCVANAAGSGTVTSITAGTGLTGGVITTSGTINLSTALLAAGHTDTVAAGPTRGDLIVANSTPAWARKAVGAVNTVFASNGTDPSWSSTPTVTTLTDTSDLDITPAAGNTYELSANASVLYLTDKTDGNLLFFYDKDDRFFLPQTGTCTGIATFNSNGLMSCTTVAAGAAKTTKYIPFALSTVYTQNSNMFWTATNGTNFDYGTYSFLKSVTGQSFWVGIVPNDIATTTNWNVVLNHKAKSGNAANVVVTWKCLDRGNSVAWDAALTALTATKVVAVNTSANLTITTLNPTAAGYDSLLTLTAGDVLVCELDRVGGNAGDTLADDWQLVSPPVLKVDVN